MMPHGEDTDAFSTVKISSVPPANKLYCYDCGRDLSTVLFGNCSVCYGYVVRTFYRTKASNGT